MGKVSRMAGALTFATLSVLPLSAQLNQTCTVSVLNRNVPVKPDGSWVLPNVPANMGQVKARATCVEAGITRSGESTFFIIPANGAVNLPDIRLGSATQIPETLTIAPANPALTTVGQSLQLTVTARYPNGSTANVTQATNGTSYTTSNPSIATISPNGLVTAVASGTVVIQAINDGAPGIATVRVTLSNRDSDSDGIADDIEIQNGLNPKNPVDGQEDFDRDGLTNAEELARGTNMRNADSDADGLLDGDEVARGTNPLLADTDGDLIPDGVEIQTATNPLNRSSYDLRRAAATSSLTPANFVLNTSPLTPGVSQQLRFQVNLIDGKTTLDLTARTTGTTYASSNLNSCNFGAQDGLVFAAQPGTCQITVSNNTLSLQATGLVQAFTPAPISFLSIPGTALNVDVNGGYAYVAAGAAGLVVVDIADRASPRVVIVHDTPGFANDIVVAGNYAYVADGSAGLRIVNITDPRAPVFAGSISAGGDAQDVVVRGSTAVVGYSGAFAGIQVVDVSTPTAPRQAGRRALAAGAIGVDYDPARRAAVAAMGTNGVAVLDLSDLANPVLTGSLAGGDVQDVVLRGNYAYLADIARSMTVIDVRTLTAPAFVASTPPDTGGRLADIAITGNFAFGADIFFVNDVPIVDVSNPTAPTPRFLLPFRQYRDDDASGIAVDGAFVYLTANRGDGRLYIGQYQPFEDRAGNPPSVQLTGPAGGSTVYQGSTILISANASDDVAVAGVSFFDRGTTLIGSDTSAPYEASYLVPNNVLSLILTAVATDLGGNTATSTPVTLNVIPDPGTTVTGRVLNSGGAGVAGANVATLGRTGTSAGDGTFAIGAVPTVRGDVSVVATATIAGDANAGVSPAVPPVRGGTTNVGNITIRPCLIAPTGLTGFWPADGTTNELVRQANAVLNAGATFAPGFVNQAFSMNGSAYVSVPDSAGLNPVNGITVETWVRRTAPRAGYDPIVKKSGPGQVNGFALEYGGSNIIFYVYTNTWYSSGGANLPDGVWHHVAGTYDGASIRLYIDGALASSGGAPGPLTPSPGQLEFGRDPSNHDRLFNGLIDEVSLYDRALSATEIQTIFAAGGRGKCRF